MSDIKTRLALPLAAVALFVAGCGSDSEKSKEPVAQTTPTTPTTTTTAPTAPAQTNPAPVEATPAGGEDAAKDAILKFTFEGDCESMTDKFLEEQAFTGDTREERCAYIEKTFTKPQYSEDDLKFRSVKIEGGEATVVVGSDIADITTTYTLLANDGKWQIDEAN